MRRAVSSLAYALLASLLAGCPDATRGAAPAGSADAAPDEAFAATPGGRDGEGGSPASDASDAGDAGVELLAAIATSSIAVDDTNIYYTETSGAGAGVYQCAKAGCPSGPTRLARGVTRAGLFVDDGHVYWSISDPGSGTGAAEVHSTAVGAEEKPGALPLTTGVVAFAVGGGYLAIVNGNGQLRACAPSLAPSSCSVPSLLAGGQGVDSTLTLADDVVYWLPKLSSGGLNSCAATGCAGTPTPLSSGSEMHGTELVVRNAVAYWLTVGSTPLSPRSILSCPLAGCAQPAVVGTSRAPHGLATDGREIYWMDDFDHAVYRCKVTGCGAVPEAFATAQSLPANGNVALDDSYAYWGGAGLARRRR